MKTRNILASYVTAAAPAHTLLAAAAAVAP